MIGLDMKGSEQKQEKDNPVYKFRDQSHDRSIYCRGLQQSKYIIVEND